MSKDTDQFTQVCLNNISGLDFAQAELALGRDPGADADQDLHS